MVGVAEDGCCCRGGWFLGGCVGPGATSRHFFMSPSPGIDWDGFQGVRVIAVPGSQAYARNHGVYLADKQVGCSPNGITPLEPPRSGRGFLLPSPALWGLCPFIPVGSVWRGVPQNPLWGCLSPRGWCTTSSTEARRCRSGSVQGPMAASRWCVTRVTSPRVTCPPC